MAKTLNPEKRQKKEKERKRRKKRKAREIVFASEKRAERLRREIKRDREGIKKRE